MTGRRGAHGPWAACEHPARSGNARRQWLHSAAALGAASLLPGCALQAEQDHTGADAPEAAPPTPLADQPQAPHAPQTPHAPHRPRLAWVFSSGGPRGFVHVGVVKALHELGLQPDLIAGASVGALVGTLCAAGMPAAEIERAALSLQPWELVRWAPGSSQRLAATGLADWVQQAVGGRPLQALPTPVLCAVLRLRDGAVLGFNRGHAGLAVQASSAIEGRFTPVTIRGEAFADADQRMPLPVRLARAAGATRVLAVDASAHEDRAPAGALRYRESDLHKRALTAPDARLADVLLHPDFGYWVSTSDAFRRRAIDAGYRATLAAAPALHALHALHAG